MKNSYKMYVALIFYVLGCGTDSDSNTLPQPTYQPPQVPADIIQNQQSPQTTQTVLLHL